MEPLQIGWKPPSAGFIQICVDGSVKDGMMSIGGVARDEYGNWQVGWAGKSGEGDILQAEMLAFYHGLQVARVRGYSDVEIRSDSTEVVRLINQGASPRHPLYTLVEECRSLMLSFSSVNVGHVYREANYVADLMAEEGHNFDNIRMFSQPPEWIIEPINFDKNGGTTPRWVKPSKQVSFSLFHALFLLLVYYVC